MQNRNTARRGQPLFLLISTVIALIFASSPMAIPAVAELQHSIKINSDEYKKTYGSWEVLNIPKEFQSNTIHAAAMPTGKVLLVAGSGNNRQAFNTYYNNGTIEVLKSAIYNPDDNSFKLIHTPSDLFCSGHTLMQSGNLLIAGGTSGYELLQGDVKKAAGPMILHNENPDSKSRTFKKGTIFTSKNGLQYVSTQDIEVEPAMKHDYGNGNVTIHHSSTKVFVEAVSEGQQYMTSTNQQYKIDGLHGDDTKNIYGQGGPMTYDKQDYRGDNKSYEFDPYLEKYIQTGNLKESRWYPSLPVLTNGNILAVSGLDNTGKITETTEYYDPSTKQWKWGPNQEFPTYPALFRTQNPDILFYSGSSAGYGPSDKGRSPGFWNYVSDTFTPVSGLRDPQITETGASIVLPPKYGSNDGSQSSRIMIAGGGGIGESNLVTSRTDIIDLKQPTPTYTPGPNLQDQLRYVNMVVLPWDEIFISGGSKDYRAKNNSYSYKSVMLNPTTNELKPMADELVGRSYHSGTLLLRDGRILAFGNDPLYEDKDNTRPGVFEQRIEIYTPPQLYRGKRPKLNITPNTTVKSGTEIEFNSSDGESIVSARLIPPSSTTHVTNIEQRSIAAIVKSNKTNVSVKIPGDPNTLTKGSYMLFFINKQGVPSVATMLQVE